MKKKEVRIIWSVFAALIIVIAAAVFPLTTYASTYEHNPAFSYGSSSKHIITYTPGTVSGYAEVKGMPQSTYRLVVGGAAFLPSGLDCGTYYGTAIVNPSSSVSVQSNYGVCSGNPSTAGGYAQLNSCTVLSGGAVVLGTTLGYDVLP